MLDQIGGLKEDVTGQVETAFDLAVELESKTQQAESELKGEVQNLTEGLKVIAKNIVTLHHTFEVNREIGRTWSVINSFGVPMSTIAEGAQRSVLTELVLSALDKVFDIASRAEWVADQATSDALKEELRAVRADLLSAMEHQVGATS